MTQIYIYIYVYIHITIYTYNYIGTPTGFPGRKISTHTSKTRIARPSNRVPQGVVIARAIRIDFTRTIEICPGLCSGAGRLGRLEVGLGLLIHLLEQQTPGFKVAKMRLRFRKIRALSSKESGFNQRKLELNHGNYGLTWCNTNIGTTDTWESITYTQTHEEICALIWYWSRFDRQWTGRPIPTA